MDKKLGEEYRLKGNEALIKKNYKDAVNWFTKGLDVLKEASTYSNRAMAYFRMGEHAMAVNDADCAIKLDPTFIKAYFRRGHAYFELGDYD